MRSSAAPKGDRHPGSSVTYANMTQRLRCSAASKDDRHVVLGVHPFAYAGVAILGCPE
ncbi:hypothetical protein ACIG54_33070 [Streptomyces achromogenes]|uniref:hypothetical protein n=1 Tax=Streptomyces achromogenes TaxID=67255 RepID=UPI0037D2C75A